jgi:hypothetical protein
LYSFSVVTGIRFVISNKAIYPQIEIGKLLPMATIDNSSVVWYSLPTDQNFITFDYDNHQIEFGDFSSTKFSESVVTGKFQMEIGMALKTCYFLNTGVQFKYTFIGASWSIYGRKLVDFNRGILGSEENVNSVGNYRYDASDLIPGLSSGKRFTIGKNRRVSFGISNEDEDAGQSFVPYFDGNEVTFDIKSPLTGISLIHYTNDPKYAGFIRPVIRSLDYRKLFSTSYQVEKFAQFNQTQHKKGARSISSRMNPVLPVVIILLFINSINLLN